VTSVNTRNESVPCYGCGDRAPGCHGRCERYKGFEALRAEARKQKEANIERMELSYESYCRAMKGRRRR
jgi:hypothetical protein